MKLLKVSDGYSIKAPVIGTGSAVDHLWISLVWMGFSCSRNELCEIVRLNQWPGV